MNSYDAENRVILRVVHILRNHLIGIPQFIWGKDGERIGCTKDVERIGCRIDKMEKR